MLRQKQNLNEEAVQQGWQRQEETPTDSQMQGETSASAQPVFSSEERVTPEEWEAMAARVGIQTRATVRPVVEREVVPVRRIRPLRRTMNARERFLVGGMPLLYGLNVFLTVLLMNDPPLDLLYTLAFFLPQVVSLMLGMALGRKGRAALAGALTNACTVAAIIAAKRIVDGNVTGTPQDWEISALLLLGGALSGAFGATLRQAFTSRRSEV